jgi:glycosyltransferase involved in cell wall biosynthesis
MRSAGRMNVLFAIPTLDKGGPDRVFFELIRSLDRARFLVSLAVSSSGGHYLRQLPSDVAIHSLPQERSVWTRYPVWPLARLVRHLNPDVVLATLRMTMTAGLAKSLFPPHTRLVSRVANQLSSNATELIERAPLKHRVSRRLQLLSLARADWIICQSRDMADDLDALGNRVPKTVIGNPIDLADILAHASAPARLLGAPALFSAGRLARQKGFDVLLDAFARLRIDFPGAVLSIAGEGPERDSLTAQCDRLNIADAVQFLGFVNNPYPMMRTADLFVLASRYEGFPNVALEAVACGAPVVATDCPGGTRDVVVPGVTGWLARPGDSEHLAQMMAAALGNRRELNVDRARDYLAQQFGANRVALAYEKILAAST